MYISSRTIFVISVILTTFLIFHSFNNVSFHNYYDQAEFIRGFMNKDVQEKGPFDHVYVVLSSDLNLYYFVHMPIIVQYWKNFGIKTYLMITLKEGERIEDDKAAKKVVEFVEGQGAAVAYFQSKKIKSGQFAQTLRCFAAGTEFAHTLDPNNTIFITSDVDFFPSKTEFHVPNLTKGEEILFYDKSCCGDINWKGVKFEMYIMITIAMTLNRWRETMGLSHVVPVDSDFVEDYTNQTFDGEVNKMDQWGQWFLDQKFFGLKFWQWKRTHRKEYHQIIRNIDRRGKPRLERNHWPKDEELERIDDIWKAYESAHITPGIFLDNVWAKNLLFYKKIFPESQIQQFSEFRDSVIPLMNITETMRRHYHPEQNAPYWNETFSQKGMLGNGT
ncbi:unnamed protein product [Bursaphelenchus xylophilus]|uniref:(pine wood nematode) hypothetical protein n=1 Tax=Bursaphelenchus xylophilus TaxID=6326 RepID=A0A1I7RPD1_BURXY|nr:unnamed protein product [Bursaphelenchus xylophilus]CAG9095826.1 unnamed protein product [Bursaphelenchus xylophilus]